MKRLFTLTLLTLILASFVLPVMAQDETPVELPAWTLGLPTVLIGLVTFNFKSTEWFKRTLASLSDSNRVPFELPKEIQGNFVLLFSVGLGLGSAWIVPHATDSIMSQYPDMPSWASVLLTGFGVSVVGGMVYEVLGRLGTSKQVYTTSTTISAPPNNSPAAKETMAVVGQAVAAETAKG